MNWYFSVLKNYVQFSGRARRKEYWYFMLFNLIITYTLVYVGFKTNFTYLNAIYTILVLLPTIAAGVRRMHDIGKSGWFIIIPIVNIILACFPGTVGANEYGDDPKQGEIFGAADYEKPYDINA